MRVAAADTQAPVPTDVTVPPLRITYISWAESCSRSDHTARELGGTSHMVYAGRFGSKPSTILFKYAAQWRATSRILAAERPDVVFVMTPPVIAALPALVYTTWHKRQLVLDAHTDAFLHPRWRWFQGLQHWLCRRATTTLSHNQHLASIVRTAGGHATLVPDVPVVYPSHEPFPRTGDFTVAVVCSFNRDEPVAAVFDAARRSPGVRFFVTGNPHHLSRDLAADLPPNLTLTGFLSVPAYAGLLTSADVALVLTNLDHTMLRGAYEAIYQGTPVIVSDWPILRESFSSGAVHVDNSSVQIAEAVRTVSADLAGYRAGARALRAEKLARWQTTRAELVERLLTARTQ